MTPDEYLLCTLRGDGIRHLTRSECRSARLCWWCGETLTGRQIYWCSEACVEDWRTAHDWTKARVVAMQRANWRCLRCGAHPHEVNHREPLVGRGYHSGCVHHPENLEPLCHDCHVAETTRQLYERRQKAIDEGRDHLGRLAPPAPRARLARPGNTVTRGAPE